MTSISRLSVAGEADRLDDTMLAVPVAWISLCSGPMSVVMDITAVSMDVSIGGEGRIKPCVESPFGRFDNPRPPSSYLTKVKLLFPVI